jgi:hypothetical protein
LFTGTPRGLFDDPLDSLDKLARPIVGPASPPHDPARRRLCTRRREPLGRPGERHADGVLCQ